MSKRSAPDVHVLAVITGDIVGSTKLSPAEMKIVRGTIAAATKTFVSRNDAPIKGVEFFQGDSWQLVLNEPHNALNATLLIQAALRAKTGVETRAAIGIGKAEGLETHAAISTGEAFTLSGRALENIPNAFRLTGALPLCADPSQTWFPGILHLCSALIRGWTRRQSEVMEQWLSLPAPSYELIANNLKITKQSVSDILTSANLPALREAMAIFHATNWQNLTNHEQKWDA